MHVHEGYSSYVLHPLAVSAGDDGCLIGTRRVETQAATAHDRCSAFLEPFLEIARLGQLVLKAFMQPLCLPSLSGHLQTWPQSTVQDLFCQTG